MQDVAPPLRRLIALILLGLAILGILQLVVMPVVEAMNHSLERLADARFLRERAEFIASKPEPENYKSLPADILIRVPNSEVAQQSLAAQINAELTAFGLSAESLSTRAVGKSSVIADIVVRGEEVGVMRFLGALESGRPLIRASGWTIEAVRDVPGTTHLTASFTAGWAKP